MAIVMAVSTSTASAAPPGFVGMTSDDLYFYAGEYRETNLLAQRAAGVDVLRVTFSWAAFEYEPGKIEYINYDNYLLDAARHGISVMPVLFDPPAWRERRPGKYTSPPISNEEMAAWVAPLVERYGPNGSLWRSHPEVTPHPATAWQIWNEPTLRQYWAGKPNIEQYKSMLRTMGAAIKGRDPNAEIVTAGIPPSFQSGAIRLKPALNQLYKGSGSSAFDTLAINSYATSARGLGKLIGQVRAIMNRRGGRADGIRITELGWCDKGPRHRFCVGARKQAKNIGASLKLIKKQRRAWKLRGFVLFSWRDAPPVSRRRDDEWGYHTGLLNHHGKRKPAYKAFVRGVRGL